MFALAFSLHNKAWFFWGRVSNFDQSGAIKQFFLASDWLKFGTLPRKKPHSFPLFCTILFMLIDYRICLHYRNTVFFG